MLLESVIGHRGCAALAPENTLAGIRKAHELGISAVEIDVVLTADGQLVIHHDRTVKRCTDGRGEVLSLTLEQLQQLDAGSWFAPEYAGEKIPTLKDALQLIQQLGLKLNLEIKMHRHAPEPLVEPVIGQLQQCWSDNHNLVISSFDHQALKLCHQLAPEYNIGHLFEALPSDWEAMAAAVHAKSIHVCHKKLKAAQAEAIKKAGYELYVYTVNHTDNADHFFNIGVDGLFSDEPHPILPPAQTP
ncbi:glycerophosphoryl diester phosphodiesterase [Endozoicomonadaceae bacterium StTr2]